MSEELTFTGMFYKPGDDPHRMIPGELHVSSKEGAILTLYGSFVPIDYDDDSEYMKLRNERRDDPEQTLIVGVTYGYRDKVTLYHCTPLSGAVFGGKMPQ